MLIEMRTIILFIFIFLSFNSKAQQEYYKSDFLRYDDYIYSENITTVQLLKYNTDFALPAIQLGTEEKLLLTFDDLNSGTKGYYYKVILCNNNWSPADLMPIEYLEGFNETYFNESRLSFNTTRKYSHYETTIPSPEISFTRSGNYLLYVYSENSPEKPILTRRFYVFENKISIQASANIASSPHDRLTHQDINLVIDKLDYNMPEIYGNLLVKVQQNGRKDNIKILDKPKSISGNKIIYSEIGEITFAAGNEFRKMDLRSFKIQSANMLDIKYDTSGYQIYMLPDAIRANKKYINYQDINGNFKIINWDDPHLSESIESDYTYVHLTLPVNRYSMDGEYYILGEFTNWRLDQKYKLTFNSNKNAYEKLILLKQAYYDYIYVFVPNESKIANTNLTEGNFSDTENQYHVFVYYRDPGELNDKLIGIKSISTR